MHEVVHQPKVVVVGHSHIQLLHELRTIAAAGHGTFNLELAGEEFLVLGLDLIDNTRSVDVFPVRIEVDWLKLFSTCGLLVVVVKDARELRVFFTRDWRVSRYPEAVQPLSCQFIV